MRRLISALLLLVVCRAGLAVAEKPQFPQRLPTAHLPNVYRIHDKVISGGQPAGEPGFCEIAELGIRTIISVDGARPEVELARKFGLQYVHLPHGYDGISQHRLQELAKAVRELEGPIYIHCHHGRHRSPAAAAAACVAAGLIEPSDALAVLTTAGTSPQYQGLYRTVADARKLDPDVLTHLPSNWREVAEVPPMAVAMVGIEQTFDRLDRLAHSGWRAPPNHPDLDAAHEALLLREHFTELLRTADVRRRSDDFRALLRESEADATRLEEDLREWTSAGQLSPIPAVVSAAYNRLGTSCKTCHQRFRDRGAPNPKIASQPSLVNGKP